MKFDIVALGNALLDYQIQVPHSFLRDESLKPGTMTLVDEESQLQLLEKIQIQFGHQSIRMTSGGSAANSIVGATSYGAKTCYIGKVSDDTHGLHYLQDMKRLGIETLVNPENHGATGTCLALITPDAERTMLTHLGVAVKLAPSDVQPEYIQNSSLLYIEGYLWDSLSAREACLKAMDIAKAHGKKVAFTLSDSFCVTRHRTDFLDLIKSRIDVLFCNEAEAHEMTNSKDISSVAREVRNWAPITCITRGHEGALIVKQKEAYSIPTWPVSVVDTLGAGDLFAAGVLYGLAKDFDLKMSGLLGCFSASKVVSQWGARLDTELAPYIQEALKGPFRGPLASAV